MTVLAPCAGDCCGHARRLPPQLSAAEAADVVLQRPLGGQCRSARLLHHP